MKFIDSHCHMDSRLFSDNLDEFVGNARSAGLEYWINPSSSFENMPKVLGIAEKYDECFAAVGIHPRRCPYWHYNDIRNVRDAAKNSKVVAIGEVGLDYMFNVKTPKKTQFEALNAQIDLAHELKLPVIFHNRNTQTYLDTLDLVRRSSMMGNERLGVLHGYNNDYEIARAAIDLGLHLSFAGRVAYENAKKLPDLIKKLPLDRILVETDAPCAPPDPYRRTSIRSEPAHVKVIIEKISLIHGKDPDEVAYITASNAKKLFNLK